MATATDQPRIDHGYSHGLNLDHDHDHRHRHRHGLSYGYGLGHSHSYGYSMVLVTDIFMASVCLQHLVHGHGHGHGYGNDHSQGPGFHQLPKDSSSVTPESPLHSPVCFRRVPPGRMLLQLLAKVFFLGGGTSFLSQEGDL